MSAPIIICESTFAIPEALSQDAKGWIVAAIILPLIWLYRRACK